MIPTRIFIQKHRIYFEMMVGLCRKSYLVGNAAPWSNYQHCFWVMTERKKKVRVIIVVICDLLYIKKVQADKAVCKYVSHIEMVIMEDFNRLNIY